MRYVQLVFTESQVTLLAGAVGNARLDAEGQEREQLTELTDFLYAVETYPEQFPIKTQGMARSIKKRTRMVVGPAQPPRKPNQRKRAQLRSQGSQKRTRAERRAFVAEFNATREAWEKTIAERAARAAELAEPTEKKPSIFRVPGRRNRG